MKILKAYFCIFRSSADTIRELEKRIQVLTLDAEKVSGAKQTLEQTKIELESRVEQLTADYNEYKIRYDQLGKLSTVWPTIAL